MPPRKRSNPAPFISANSKRSKASHSYYSHTGDDGQAGIIEKVTLKNFMCHANLEFKFHSCVNFIVGNNGSGKSAVMNGIILALGGKGSVTGRNSNIKDFVQHGKQVATLEVTFRNTGSDAYEPNIFGPRIIIERKIFADGASSTYKVKGDGGKLISHKKADVENVTNAFNIQVDNPVSLLTQSTSKVFMNSKNASEKFKLFFKATCLQDVEAQYNVAEENLKNSTEKLVNKTKELEETKSEIKKLEDELKRHESFDLHRRRIAQIDNESNWAHVIHCENEESKLVEKKTDFQNKIDALERKCLEFETEQEDCILKIRSEKVRLGHLKNSLQELKTERDAVLEELQPLQTTKLQYNEKLSRINESIRTYQSTIREFQNKILELQNGSGQLAESDRQMKQAKITSLRKELGEMNLKERECQKEMTVANNTLSQITADLDNIKYEIQQLSYKFQDKQKEITNAERIQKSNEYQYGQDIPELLRRINSAHARGEFKKKPIGPIGRYLRILDPKWLFTIETCLSQSLLKSFCCDNKDDYHRLSQIMSEVCRGKFRPSIITTAFLNSVHDVSQFKVSSNHNTVFDLIESEEPVVMNCLVDQRSIESILLIEHSSEAVNLMMDNPPKGCHNAYTIKGDQVYPHPQYRYYSCKTKPNTNPLLKTITSDDISYKKNELAALLREREAKTSDEKISKSLVKGTQDQLEKMKNYLKVLWKNRNIKEHMLNELDVPESNVDVTTLQTELENYERKAEDAETEKQQLQFKLNEVAASLVSVRSHKEDLSGRMEQLRNEIGEISGIISKCEEMREKLNERIKKRKQFQKEEKKKIEKTDEEIAANSARREGYLETALQMCPRVVPEKSIAALQREKTDLEEILRQHEGSRSLANVQQIYLSRKERFKDISKGMKSAEELRTKFKASLFKKMNKFLKIQQDTCLNVRYNFNNNLTLRYYVGNLNIDTEKKTMEIYAATTIGKDSQVRPVHSLSGGERSYIMVSLLLALWDVTESPFRILDEYDVFMDGMNRDMSTKYLLENAKLQQKYQFIFLSPLDLPENFHETIDPSLVAIHKMPDIVRTAEGMRKPPSTSANNTEVMDEN